jgi:hypothetical protein
MEPAGIETVRLNGAVAVRCQVAVFEMVEGNGLARSIGQRRPDVRRLAVVLDEGDGVRGFGQYEQPLLQAQEQGIDRLGLVLGFVLFAFTNGKGVEFSVVAEENLVASVSLLQRRHVSALRSITATSGKRLYQNFTQGPRKAKSKRPRFDVTSCPDCSAGDRDRTCTPFTGTRPSTWLSYQRVIPSWH